MKKIFESAEPPTPASLGTITLEKGPVYDTLGPKGFVQVTTLYFEKDTRIDEIVDVDVYEKRRHDDILRRHVPPPSR